MAAFIHFPQANDVLKAAPGTEDHVSDLHIFRQHPYVVSFFAFTDEEKAQVVESRQVYLQVLGSSEATAADYYLHRFSLAVSFDAVPIATPQWADFKGTNTTFPPLHDGWAPMPIFMQPLPGEVLPAGSYPCVVLGFELSEADIAQVEVSGGVYLKVLGFTHPPVSVYGISPIVFEEATPAAE